ncbi:MAG: thiolase family protein [Bacillota bacterium]
MEVAVVGLGITRFGHLPHLSLEELGMEAAKKALKDAGIGPGDIQIACCANVLAPNLQNEFTIGQKILWELGINKIPVINVENACSSSSSAFYLACLAIQAGAGEVALVVGVEKMLVPRKNILDAVTGAPEAAAGFSLPAAFALKANRYMHKYGVNVEDLALVAVKNRRHGSLNPFAQYREPITKEDVLNSPVIAEPLTRLSCCPQSDGAAAVVICRNSMAKRFRSRPVYVSASVLLSGSYANPPSLSTWEADFRAAEKAYAMAGVGPEDLDVVELHDAFTIAEIMHYEGLGLATVGEGVRLVKEGFTFLGGNIPVNPSGGLLSRGHPLGATGVAQVLEIALQLRGEAGVRQVKGARVGLAHCMGGELHGDARSVTIHIFST